MFSSPYVATAVRFVVFAALQVLVLSRIGAGEEWARYVQPLLYPVVVLLLPVGLPTVVVLAVAFALGLAIDVFVGAIGIHAAALVITGFARSAALALLEPREGYNIGQVPTRRQFGMQWFASYAAILLGVHVFSYFAVEAFTFVYIGEILMRAVGSFCVSMILVLLYVLVFDPRA